MPTIHTYPYGQPGLVAPPELFEARDRLRDADFDPWLLDAAVPKLKKYADDLAAGGALSPLDEIYHLWAVCLQAEIYDYFDRHKAARAVLAEAGPRLEKLLDGHDATGFRDLVGGFKPLMRQRFWALVFYAHSQYREPDLEKARATLEKIRRVVDVCLGPAQNADSDAPSFGLRARIAYSLGQVHRQSGRVSAARTEFITAIEMTRKRLSQKTKKYRELGNQEIQHQEQRYANYIIAKANSFGLAWAAYNTGELQRARGAAAAGCTLLETTPDTVHRAYAQLIYAQILRATAEPVSELRAPSPDLSEALSILEPLVDEDHSPLRVVRRFLLRARYEYARVLDLLGRYGEAEERTLAIYEGESEGSRWRMACGIFLCRLLLKQDRIADALRYSGLMIRSLAASAQIPPPLRAETLINHAEVMMCDSPPDLEAIDKALLEAEALRRGNPLASAVCHLQRVRFYCLQQNVVEARSSLAKWDASAAMIEHGSLRALAAKISSDFRHLDPRFIVTPADFFSGGYNKVEQDLRRWILMQRYNMDPENYLKQEFDPLIGRSKRAIENWEKDLKCIPSRGKRDRK